MLVLKEHCFFNGVHPVVMWHISISFHFFSIIILFPWNTTNFY